MAPGNTTSSTSYASGDASATSLLLYCSILAAIVGVGSAFRVTGVEVPQFLLSGQRATLKCHLDLGGEQLYSLKWWKDGKQFFQYIPRNKPARVVFTVDGITVNPSKAGYKEIELLDVGHASSGQYRCEAVAEAPSFTTHERIANMTIIDQPDGGPIVTGVAQSYRVGELIALNCSSRRSRPAAQLMWTLNGHLLSEQHVITYPVVEEGDSPALYTNTLGLTLTATLEDTQHLQIALRCIATVVNYQWTKDVVIQLENTTSSKPRHLPTLQQTGGAATQALASNLQLLLTCLLLGFICAVIHGEIYMPP